jgi:hypothetical protein
MTEFNVAAYTNAYLQGNEAAQSNPVGGLYQMATAAGYVRDSLFWDAFVAGGAAFLFNGHVFETRALIPTDPKGDRG